MLEVFKGVRAVDDIEVLTEVLEAGNTKPGDLAVGLAGLSDGRLGDVMPEELEAGIVTVDLWQSVAHSAADVKQDAGLLRKPDGLEEVLGEQAGLLAAHSLVPVVLHVTLPELFGIDVLGRHGLQHNSDIL